MLATLEPTPLISSPLAVLTALAAIASVRAILAAYRDCRDQLSERIKARLGITSTPMI